ncbi:MAG: cation-translocating P-type ATPase [Verrucomicrobia bacterium]|nr:cation-translocating P-type ATPase [Verrucomicrobiota bacterium]
MSVDKKFWWSFSTKQVYEELSTTSNQGLSSAIAKARIQTYGHNELPEAKPPSIFKLFFNQFSSFIVWILIIAAAIAGVLGEWVDAIAILVIVILNAILGFVQEINAERSLAALKKLATPTCKIIRDGVLQTIFSREIVPGDLILLEAGDLVPADGRVTQSVQLSTQEASLTGESLPTHKMIDPLANVELPIGDRKNMVFMGSIVLSGKGHMIATATGLNTELGKIASLLSEHKEEQTPLQIRLEQLGRRLVFLCLGIVAVVFVLGLLRGNSFIDVLLTATSLAVAAVPEGLPAIVTISLAIGIRKMAKRRALIRRLPSVETLGCASVICTDKTGTLTKNEMSVRKVWVNKEWIEVSGTGYAPEGNYELKSQIILPKDVPELRRLLEIGLLCNSANLVHSEQGWEITGDPTEGALIVAAEKGKIRRQEIEEGNPIVGEIPFDSERKRMSVLRKTPEGNILFVKGAPDLLLSLSQSVLIQGEKIPLTSNIRNEISEANRAAASTALRVLAMAYKEVSDSSIDESMEEDLTFVGLMAMMDPPRPEAKQAIQTCKKAGIITVMITGDHKDTAEAVAQELGLMTRESRAISGVELQQMSDDELKQSLRRICVYARVSAEHKLRIVRAWRSLGEIVAVTGDGVNDAPAIKEADIGIAMGIKGTDVTKEAADMIITDDNFASIVNAVEEGRGIYDNITKFVNYLISSNIAEIMVIFAGMAIGFKDPLGNPFVSLSAVQLLLLNLVTDGFPAIALGMDPVDPKAMQRLPRKASEPILSARFSLQLFLVSVLIASGTLVSCHFGLRTSSALAQTMAFTTLVVLELVRVQMVRSQYHIGFFSNRWIIGALVSSLLIQLIIIYFPPLQMVFGTVALGLKEWGVIAVVAFVVGVGGVAINRLFRKRPT